MNFIDRYHGVIFEAFWVLSAVIWVFAVYGFIKMLGG